MRPTIDDDTHRITRTQVYEQKIIHRPYRNDDGEWEFEFWGEVEENNLKESKEAYECTCGARFLKPEKAVEHLREEGVLDERRVDL